MNISQFQRCSHRKCNHFYNRAYESHIFSFLKKPICYYWANQELDEFTNE